MPPEIHPATSGGAVQTMEELRRQNEEYRRFFDLALDMICIAGTDGFFKKLNPAWERTLGFTKEELLARPFVEFIHPDDRAGTMAEVEKLAHGADVVRFENRCRHKDGSYRWFSWKAPAIRPGEDHLCATARDITERVRAEQRITLQLAVSRVLAESDTLDKATPRLMQAIATAMDAGVGAIWRADAAAGVLRCANVWHAPGIDVAEFERLTMGSVFPSGVGMPGRVWKTGEAHWIPDVTVDPNFPRAAEAKAAGLHAAFGAPIFSGQAFLGMFEVFMPGMPEPDAELLAVCGGIGSQIGQFIERKRTEAELHDREARMRAVLENAAEGIITIDERGTIESANATAERIFGYTLAEMAGRNVSMLMPPPYREEHDGYVANYIRTGNAKVIGGTREVAGRRKDGSEFPIDLAVGEVQVEGKRLFTGFVRDITARKHAEREVAHLGAEAAERAAQLEAANKELEAFSYSVSHDLRAPLRHVQGYVALLKKALGDSLPETAARYLEVIVGAGTQMGQLIDDLLAFSRIGRIEMHRSTVNLDLLLQGCVASLDAETSGRNIIWRIAPLPAVAGDPAMLRQVFTNLLDNAVKYTAPRDPAEIEIGTCGNEAGRAIFYVRDNGVGFDMQFADKLFGVFQRLHTSEEFEGTGIGLANVRRIITRHGGRVWPEAELGKGATFFFTLEEAAPAWDAAAML